MILELQDPLPALELLTNLALVLSDNPTTNRYLAIKIGVFKKIAPILSGNNQPDTLETCLKLVQIMMVDMGGARDELIGQSFE